MGALSKPTIQFTNEQHDYLGEFIEPNIILIYLDTHNRIGANPLHTIVHEYTHYRIYRSKLLSWLFNKLDSHVIRKYLGKLPDPGDIYVYLPEERFCNYVANKFCRKYLNPKYYEKECD